MIFDGHGDILTDVMEQARLGKDIWNDYHMPLYRQAGVTGGIFVNFTDPNADNQSSEFKQISDVAIEYFKANNDVNIVLDKKGFNLDKFNLILGIEGMNAVSDASQLDELYDLGYRHVGITWNEKNVFASGTTNLGGLTAEGKNLIERCNQLGMVVDFAHLNDQSFEEAAAVTTKPIFFSHGNVRALCDHVRNLSDEQLELVKASNGVIGLAAMAFFLNEDQRQASIDDLVKHVLYVKDNFGIDHVGLGLDFCYYLGSHDSYNDVQGLHHISDISKLQAKLNAAGLTTEEIEKVCYKNMVRVITDHLK